MVHAQRPAHSCRTAEQVADLRGKAVDEVQQRQFCGVPLFLPLGDGVLNDLRLVGSLVRRLAALPVALGQGNELLRALDTVGGQDLTGSLPGGLGAKQD